LGEKEPPGKSPEGQALSGRRWDAKALSATVACLVIVFILAATPYIGERGSYRVGSPSPDTVVATRSFQVEDPERTDSERARRREEVKSAYVKPGRGAEATAALHSALHSLREWLEQGASSEDASLMAQSLGLFLTPQEVEVFAGADEETRTLLERSAAEALAYLETEPISSENLAEAKAEAAHLAGGLPLDEELSRLAGALASSFVVTNTDLPASYVLAEAERQAQAVPTFYEQVNEGEVIVNKGEIVTAMTLRKLEKSRVLEVTFSVRRLLGIFLVLALLAAAFYLYLTRKKPARYLPARIQLFYPVVLVVFALLCRLFTVLAQDELVWGFMIPTPLVAMLTMIMLGRETALSMAVLSALIAGIMLKGDYVLTTAALASGLLAAFFARRADRREDLLKQGLGICLAVGLADFAVALAFLNPTQAAAALGMGAANGLLCAVLALGMLPLLEKALGATTPMRLLELASPNAPLLRELIDRAPGTYNHSLMLGNLVETAARSVGADPLLARVGAYYHDVGKIKRASFFIENRGLNEDGEVEEMTPDASARVIADHVRDGVELAQEHNLPQEVIDIIKQHHGTTLIKYFYAKALEESRNGEREEKVEEGDFRYQGEKPRSKEAAIVMLGDALEATIRSLPPGDRTSPEEIIDRVVEERLQDGQLDHSDLTMHDLDLVKRSFTQSTSGAGHERIPYPAVVEGEGEAEESSDPRGADSGPTADGRKEGEG